MARGCSAKAGRSGIDRQIRCCSSVLCTEQGERPDVGSGSQQETLISFDFSEFCVILFDVLQLWPGCWGEHSAAAMLSGPAFPGRRIAGPWPGTKSGGLPEDLVKMCWRISA